ncbi:tetratricopeptide repeat protein [Dyadobacter jejuensis]|uniref:Tetratricopeptide repeat protein n=1 Tax=Dyadobacter jejuensis TaxID=1082580 RepID=A0A316AMP6_9BACT|nr:tetratricopeptide repeat protein [Dyadobacter jejuensis]PWJ59045.1 tetratricopeptide repeat protein [Dyadobacter jejuensis]
MTKKENFLFLYDYSNWIGEPTCLTRTKAFRKVYLWGLLVPLLFLSCQKDTSSDTRIPPTIKYSKDAWQQTAITALTDLLQRGINLESNYFKRARIYYDQEDYKLALEDIDKAINENENQSDYYLLRGKVYLEMGSLAKAQADAERAEALQQSSPELYILLADIYQSNLDYRKAIAYLNQAMQMTPYDGSVYYVKGMIQAHQGDSLSSLRSLQEAITLNPRLRRAYEQSSRLYRLLHQPEQALQINALALQRFTDIPELYFERGEIYRSITELDTALIQYQKAIAIAPQYEKALLALAQTAIAHHAYAKAIPALDKLNQIRDRDLKILSLTGYAYEKLGNFVKARELYNDILSTDPVNQDARYGMYRMQQRENTYLENTPIVEPAAEAGLQRDSSRTILKPLQRRGTTILQIDTLKKAKIE